MISAKASFDVTALIYYYQPTTEDMALKTGRDGTSVVNPNFMVLQRTGETMDPVSERTIRETWSFVSKARTQYEIADVTPGDHILPTLIAAAEHGVPSEYDIRLPLPDRFKSDPTYYRAQIEQPNDAPFGMVLKALVPFADLRNLLLNMQERLIVPLHSLRIGFVASDIAFRATMPSGVKPVTNTLQ